MGGTLFSEGLDIIFTSAAFNRYRLYLASIVLAGALSRLTVEIARESRWELFRNF